MYFMGIKIKKRGPVVRNLILFVILSIAYLFILEAINSGRTALSLKSFKLYNVENVPLLFFALVVSYFIYHVKKFSKWMLLGYFALISFYSFANFFDNFDKLILIYSFIYLLFSGYFYIFWKLELKDVVYSPGYGARQIGLLNKQKLNIKISHKGYESSGFLTNIGRNSCFLYLESKPLLRKVLLSTEFDGREFCTQGEVVTSYEHGIGLKLDEDFRAKDKRAWHEYYDIITDRSIHPVITEVNK